MFVIFESDSITQILHNELEASLQRAQDDLASTTQELEKHRRLNERLESDLLKIEQHGNGDPTPADPAEDDVLAGLGLELGLTTKASSNVRWPHPFLPKTLKKMRLILAVLGVRMIHWYHKPNLYLSHLPRIRLFFPSSPASVTASGNGTQNSKR